MSDVESSGRILDELAALRSEVRALRACLLGDDLRQPGGVVQAVQELRVDVYGDDARKRIGLVERTTRIQDSLDRLERDWSKTKWTVAGWAGGAAAAATVAVNLLRMLST